MKSFRIEQRITKRTDNLNRYFNEVRAYSRDLSKEEELRLIKEAQSGNQKSRTILVSAHLPFVISVSKKYATGNNELADIISEGNIGLLKAIDSFDTNNPKNRFLSYAVWHIRGTIITYLNSKSRNFKLSQEHIKYIKQIEEFESEYKQQHSVSTDPPLDLICEHLEKINGSVNEDIVSKILIAYRYTDSLNRQVGEPGDTIELQDLLDPSYNPLNETIEKHYNAEHNKLYLNELLTEANLKPVYIRILELYYGLGQEIPEPKPVSYIAKELDLSDGTVRNMLTIIKRKLKVANRKLKQKNTI